jgi:hypothetical protein
MGVGVGVGGGTQPDAEQASQQLENFPTQTCPFFGARQCAASFLTLQVVMPRWFVWQQVTADFSPHVEFFAHLITEVPQLLLRVPALTASRSTPVAQAT